MVKKLFTLLFASVLALPVSVLLVQVAAAQEAAKEARWEGVVIRSSADNSTLTVRNVGSSDAMGQSGTRQRQGQ